MLLKHAHPLGRRWPGALEDVFRPPSPPTALERAPQSEQEPCLRREGGFPQRAEGPPSGRAREGGRPRTLTQQPQGKGARPGGQPLGRAGKARAVPSDPHRPPPPGQAEAAHLVPQGTFFTSSVCSVV